MARPQMTSSITKLAARKNQAFNSVVMASSPPPSLSLLPGIPADLTRCRCPHSPYTSISLIRWNGPRNSSCYSVAPTLTCCGVHSGAHSKAHVEAILSRKGRPHRCIRGASSMQMVRAMPSPRRLEYVCTLPVKRFEMSTPSLPTMGTDHPRRTVGYVASQ
jgi:hypothetical protein